MFIKSLRLIIGRNSLLINLGSSQDGELAKAAGFFLTPWRNYLKEGEREEKEKVEKEQGGGRHASGF